MSAFTTLPSGEGRKNTEDIFVVRSAPDLADFKPEPGDQSPSNLAKTTAWLCGVIGQQEGMEAHGFRQAHHLVTVLAKPIFTFLIICGFGRPLALD